MLLVLLVATATAALLLLPLAILQHLLVHPPELDMPSCAVRLSPALLTLDPLLVTCTRSEMPRGNSAMVMEVATSSRNGSSVSRNARPEPRTT